MKNKILLIALLILLVTSIKAQYTVGVSYYGDSSWIEYIPGNMPIIIVAPHAGNLQPASLPDINTRGRDNGTMDLALFMRDSLQFKSGGCRPHVIINHLRPNKLNPVHSASDSATSAGTNANALNALNQFHAFIQVAYDKVTTDFGKGHYFELHGNGTAEHWNMVGLGISKSVLKLSDSVINTKVNNSTIKNLCTAGGANFLEVLKGSTSLGGMLDSLGWKSAPSPAHPSPPDTATFFYAGQNTWRYGSRSSGTIDATHLESYWQFMVYNSNRSKYSNDLANSILRFMTIHYGFTFNCPTVDVTEQELTENQIKIYPNPASDNQEITIESSSKITKVLIFDTQGKLCKAIENSATFSSANLEKGIYLVRIELESGKVEFEKLVVE